MKKLLFVFLLGMLPTFIYSQDGFEYATTSKDGTDYYVKIVDDGSYGFGVKAWVKHTNKTKSFKNKKGKMVTTGGGYTLTLMEFSCNSKSYVVKQSVTYNKAGNVTSSDDMFSPISKEIVPGTVMEGIFDAVCTG